MNFVQLLCVLTITALVILFFFSLGVAAGKDSRIMERKRDNQK
jgi:hypothetical protein